jgi:Lysozyme like domain
MERLAMSLLISFLMLWIGVGQPADVAAEMHQVVFEQIADPVDRWRPLVDVYFEEGDVDTAMCIIRHESAGDPKADNPRSSATGLFQILASGWGPHFGVSPAQLLDPVTNIRLARAIKDIQGWRAWTTYRLCR